MNINVINPLLDHRWDDLVASHPRATAFHQRGWLEALARTYGYTPLVLTSASASEPLNDGMVLCRVSSWITGTRLVSLPFADHCELLMNDRDESPEFMNWLRAECDDHSWRYLELRPLSGIQNKISGLQPADSYWFHELDLRPNLEQLFLGLHKNSFQRKIRRAEKEGLTCEVGRSPGLLDEFYRLLLITRRRHGLVPQPRAWFRNLVKSLGEKLQVRVARKDGAAIAAMLTLRHKSSITYKYGCSSASVHSLGAMPLLFWRLIEEGKASETERIDLGRTDLSNQGLIDFKDRLGAKKKLLTYYRYTTAEKRNPAPTWQKKGLRKILHGLPDAVLSTAGRVLYRHMG